MRQLLLSAALTITIAFALLLQAQSSNPGQDSGQGAVDHGRQTTLQGCLTREGAYYYLTDDNGVAHRLTGGDTTKLGHYVGHEVELTGMRSVRSSDTTQEGEESTARERPAFRVHDVKDVASTCNGR